MEMVIFIKEILLKIYTKVMESITSRIKITMKEIGKRDAGKVKES